MKTQNNHLSIVAFAIVALSSGCAVQATADGTEGDRIVGTATESESGAEFDVEVRYAGGATRTEAEALLGSIEIVRASELFPDADLSHVPSTSYDEEEALDASEPTFEVMLHPRNEIASEARFAWRATAAPDRGVDRAHEDEREPNVAATQQALTLDGSIHKTLSAGATWRTARMRCYAPFTFGAEIVGIATVCADLGYDGVAGSICTAAFDPRSPVVVVHPGPDLNPLNKHYFRGRVVAKAPFVSAPAEILAAGWACL